MMSVTSLTTALVLLGVFRDFPAAGVLGAEVVCPEGAWLTFVRVSGQEPQPEPSVPPTPLYSAAYGSSITAECYNRCREVLDCAGYILTYSTASCSKVELSPDSVDSFVDSPGAAYFFKTCLSLPNNCSEKAWSVEVVPGYNLVSEPIVVLPDIHDRTECMEACVTQGSKGEPCHSANFDPTTQTCALMRTNRWASPNSFRPTTYVWEEYLENTCLAERKVSDTCWRSPKVNQTSVRADLQLFNMSKTECAERCAEEVYFRCRAFSYIEKEQQCLLHSDAALSTYVGPEITPQLVETQSAEYVEMMPCILSVLCDREHMNVTVHVKNFTGRVSVSGRSNECSMSGNGEDLTTLIVPIPEEGEENKCNLQVSYAISDYNRTQATTAVIIQRHPLIEQQGDWKIGVTCLLTEGEEQPTMFNMSLGTNYVVELPDNQAEISGEWGVEVGNITEPKARMVLLDARTGELVSEVTVGNPVILRLDIAPPYNSSLVRAHHLVAVSGDGQERIPLLDDIGCPTDRAIFPGLFPNPSLPNVLEGKFMSFRFTTSTVLNLYVNLTFSTSPIDPVNCGEGVVSYGRRKRTTTSSFTEELPLQLSIVVHSQNTNETASPILQASFGGEHDPRDGSLLCMSFLTASLIVLFFLLLQSTLVTVFCVMSRRQDREHPSDMISLGRDFDMPHRHVTFSDDVSTFPHRDFRLSTPMKT